MKTKFFGVAAVLAVVLVLFGGEPLQAQSRSKSKSKSKSESVVEQGLSAAEREAALAKLPANTRTALETQRQTAVVAAQKAGDLLVQQAQTQAEASIASAVAAVPNPMAQVAARKAAGKAAEKLIAEARKKADDMVAKAGAEVDDLILQAVQKL